MPNPVDVVVQLAGEDVLAGRLWTHRRRQSESATFSYVGDYLARPDAYALDPLLPLQQGQLQTAEGRALFGAFTDCAPDRWGQRLINRAERHRVEEEGGSARRFAVIDYLLLVRDDLRQGALRFRDPDTDAYLADRDEGIPYLIDLPVLLNAAEHLEREDETAEEVRALLRGGSSLGGARPKAHVLSAEARIAIAKFPSLERDEWDVIRWEATALELAHRAGIVVPNRALHLVDGRPVLIVDRFDRSGERRIGYVSAMTMLEETDGAGGSYLDIAEVIEQESSDATADLLQLWRRAALSILISNTDDHLRNHGFLRMSTAGWRLSPAFDINPDPRPGRRHFATAIAPGELSTIETLLDYAELFRLNPGEAEAVLRQVAEVARDWQEVAADHGINRDAIDEMATAFEHEQAEVARAIPA